MPATDFHPRQSLLASQPKPSCVASVVIPARNEEHCLPHALDALRLQTCAGGSPLDSELYEVIVLLNNCTDATAEVARRYQCLYPEFSLHIIERSLPPEEAHVGTARRLLMDTAWHRLHHSSSASTVILSTDADTTVAHDWIDRNLQAINAGAEVVGGVIHLDPADIKLLDLGTLRAYRLDRRYQRRVARLESLLDPDPADPCPRHLEHFGASLACTPSVYARAGGLPPVKPLEDVAFINACRRIGARIRHAPEVCITTSARLDGRAEVGLSGQLRHWQQDRAVERPQLVQSAKYLAHRFSSLSRLRQLCSFATLPPMDSLPACWRESVFRAHIQHLEPADFLNAVDCNRLIEETFQGRRDDNIEHAISALSQAIQQASRPAPGHSAETFPDAAIEQYATQTG